MIECAGVSLNWVGATYIDKDGVFTGTLSADTIKTISIRDETGSAVTGENQLLP